MDCEFDEEGRLVSGPIMVAIGFDRDYGIYCQKCQGKMFGESEDNGEVRCRSCDAILAIRGQEEALH
jgi:hypothetical protein